MKVIDVQRFNERRIVYDVITDKEIIIKEIQRILSFNIDTIDKKE